MRRISIVFVGVTAGVLSLGAIVAHEGKPEAVDQVHAVNQIELEKESDVDRYVLDFEMPLLEGQMQSLEEYKGKVLLLVNVASQCGYTPQYEPLQALYETYHNRGFEVVGFPANNFGQQEPGTNEEILQFCERNYGVTFPMFAKISVKGDDMHPLYQKITSQPEPIGGEIKWNFQKYLVDRDGNVVMKFLTKVEPDDERVTEAIETLLGEPS